MPTYVEALSDDRWRAKRLEILQRDKYVCQYCKNEMFISTYSTEKFLVNSKCKFSHSVDNKEKRWIIKFKNACSDIDKFALLNYAKFDIRKHYIAYYLMQKDNSNIITALRQVRLLELPDLRSFLASLSKSCPDGKVDLNSNSLLNKWFAKSSETDQGVLNKPERWEDLTWEYVSGLNVHHLCYRMGKRPWEYENADLVTACPCCHEEIHTKGQVPVYDEKGKRLGYYSPCHRCHGVGYFPEYNHVDSGVCFRCNGARYEELIEQ